MGLDELHTNISNEKCRHGVKLVHTVSKNQVKRRRVTTNPDLMPIHYYAMVLYYYYWLLWSPLNLRAAASGGVRPVPSIGAPFCNTNMALKAPTRIVHAPHSPCELQMGCSV